MSDASQPREVELEITRLGEDGLGVGRLPAGQLVAVPGTAPGDRVRVLVSGEPTGLAVGQLLAVSSPSAVRTEPRCASEGCHGCRWQHIEVRQQRLYKRERLLADLRGAGLTLADEQVRPLAASVLAWGYRLRARLRGGPRDGRWRLGAVSEQELVPFAACPLVKPELNALLAPIVELLEERDARIVELEAAWSTVSGRGAVLIRMDAAVRSLASALAGLQRELHQLKSVAVTGAGGELRRYGDDTLLYPGRAGERPLAFAPGCAVHVHPEVTELLVEALARLAGPVADEPVLDLFAGIGTMGLSLAAIGARLTAIEAHERSAAFLERNAQAGALAVRVLPRPAAASLCELAAEGYRPTLVLADLPPGGGELDPRAVLALEPARVIVIGSQPQPLGALAAGLVAGGYRPVEVHPFDMYPQTPFTLAALLLQRDGLG